MKKSKKTIIEIIEDESTIVQLEIDKSTIEFYKKETGKSRVTQKGLSDFINHLIEIYRS